MHRFRHPVRRGFTLMETVIAIGVLAVLLTAFMAVFGPATKGIRRSINVQEADRLVATLEKEMAILRKGQESADTKTAFDKAFKWIRESGTDDNKAIMLYHYRGNPSNLRSDGTMEPFVGTGVPGKDFVVQAMARLRSDSLFADDIKALESRVFAVETTQLVLTGGTLKPGKAGEIVGSSGSGGAAGTAVTSPDQFPDAVIAFTASFYDLPTTAAAYLKPGGTFKWADLKKSRKPVFTRNLGVRR
jgi:prepilin-type N-terminal cleavage/methylation domain-containing protein